MAPWRVVGSLTTDHSQGHSTIKIFGEGMYSCCFVSESQCYWVGMPGTSQYERLDLHIKRQASLACKKAASNDCSVGGSGSFLRYDGTSFRF